MDQHFTADEKAALKAPHDTVALHGVKLVRRSAAQIRKVLEDALSFRSSGSVALADRYRTYVGAHAWRQNLFAAASALDRPGLPAAVQVEPIPSQELEDMVRSGLEPALLVLAASRCTPADIRRAVDRILGVRAETRTQPGDDETAPIEPASPPPTPKTTEPVPASSTVPREVATPAPRRIGAFRPMIPAKPTPAG